MSDVLNSIKLLVICLVYMAVWFGFVAVGCAMIYGASRFGGFVLSSIGFIGG